MNEAKAITSKVYTTFWGLGDMPEFTIEKLAGMLSCLAILSPKTDKVYDYPIFTLLC